MTFCSNYQRIDLNDPKYRFIDIVCLHNSDGSTKPGGYTVHKAPTLPITLYTDDSLIRSINLSEQTYSDSSKNIKDYKYLYFTGMLVKHPFSMLIFNDNLSNSVDVQRMRNEIVKKEVKDARTKQIEKVYVSHRENLLNETTDQIIDIGRFINTYTTTYTWLVGGQTSKKYSLNRNGKILGAILLVALAIAAIFAGLLMKR